MATTVETLVVKILGDNSDLAKKLGKSSAALNRFSNNVTKVGKQWTTAGRKMTRAFTLPIVAGLAAATLAFSGFDKAMTESLAIMGNVSTKMRAEMAATAKQLSEETTFAAKDLAAAYFYLASAGLDAEQSIKSLSVVASFAQAGAFDLGSATDLLTDAQSALGLTVKDSTQNMKNMLKVSDVLVKANTLANATVEQFSKALTSQAGPAMKAYGVSIEEGVAALAVYADQGIKAELAGGMFGRALRLLTKSALENEAVFQKLGVSVFDQNGKLENFADIIDDLTRVLEPMSTKMRVATLDMLGFKARVQQTILPLIGSADKIRSYQKALEAAGGTTKDVADKQLLAFSNQMTIVKNQVVNLAAAFGEQLVPKLQKVADNVSKLTKRFSELDAKTKENVVTWLLWIAAIGPAVYIIGKIITLLGSLVKAFTAVGVSMLWLAANPMVIIAAAAVALGVTFAVLRSQMDAASEAEAESMRALGGQLDKINAKYGSIAAMKALGKKQSDELLAAEKKAREAVTSPVEEKQKDEMTSGALAAKVRFQDSLNKALFKQMSTEQQINNLIKQRNKLKTDIDAAEKNSEDFFNLQDQAVGVEGQLKDLLRGKIDTIRDGNQKPSGGSKFTAAITKGSLEEYRLKIGAKKDNDVAKDTKSIDKRISDLLEVTAEYLPFLGNLPAVEPPIEVITAL